MKTPTTGSRFPTPRAIAVAAALTVAAVIAVPARAYFAGGGKDAAKGNDCLIGYEGIDQSDVTLDGKKQVVTCMDCDPACDADGVASANGSCTFELSACINEPGVTGCTPPVGLDKAKASAKVQGVKGKIDIEVPQLLEGSVCGAPLDIDVPTKETNQGAKDGKGTVSLSASVKPDGEKKRSDKDKITVVCTPRPEGEECPTSSTTTSSLPQTSTSTTVTTSTSTTLLVTTTTSTLVTTTSTTVPTTTSTTQPAVTTTSTTVTTTTSTSTSLTSTTSTSTTTSTTTSTVIAAGCGDGAVAGEETCDDGNNSDNDNCPANCFVAACTPMAGTTRQVTASFTPPPGLDVAGLTLLMNYPEEKVFMPPDGAQTQIGAANFLPLYPSSEVLIRGADLTHAVRGLVADSTAVPPGPIFQLTFQNCQGAAAPLAGEFNCVVLDATDPFTNPVGGVTCSARLP